ncbi:MAG: hypothetical protein JKY54_13255 [Flavobacteriales bacterium]|nr:hypothetical protein [Flavobacteriales bacterium]
MATNTPTKAITLWIPPELASVIKTNGHVQGKKFSQRLRYVLDMGNGRYYARDLRSLNIPTIECDKHNLTLEMSVYRVYEHGASSYGMSVSNYVLMMLACHLADHPEIDYDLPTKFHDWSVMNFAEIETETREQAPRYMVSIKGLDVLAERGIHRPIPAEKVIKAIDAYVDMAKQFDGHLKVDLTGICFQPRHGEEKMNLKVQLPRYYDNILIDLARRSLVTKSVMFMMVLVYYSGFEIAANEFMAKAS